MKKRKLLGLFLILAGLLVFFLKPLSSITGFAITDTISSFNGVWFYALGLMMMICGGIILSLSDLASYSERDSKLKEMLSTKYEQLSDKDKISLNKSYRRHLTREEREKDIKEIKKVSESTIIRTRYFNRAIRGHEAEIERAIEKLRTGKGKKERLTNIDGFSIRTTKGGRIIYDEPKKGSYVLKDYTRDHHYAD